MKIYITGEITDQHYDGCFCPQDLKEILEGLDENETLEVEITSEGGSVFAGIQIGNMLARWKGNVITHGVGFVASIATVILMAGKKVMVDENAFCMIHLPWTMVQGNANDLEKEIDTLDKCKKAMMSFYMRHAKVDEQTIEDYLADESWFLGDELAQIFNVEILPNDKALDIAAKFDLTKYKKLPEVLNMNKTEEQADEIQNEQETIVEDKTEEVVAEPTNEEPEVEAKAEEVPEEEETEEEETEDLASEIEALKARIAELEEENAELKRKCDESDTITKDEADKRVSGMQAKMQTQVNALSTELNDFKNQLQAKDEELKSAKAEITSLNDSLNKSSEELSVMASALEEKTKALELLNSNVNTQAEELPTMKDGLAKCATPAEKVAFLKSGKYVR